MLLNWVLLTITLFASQALMVIATEIFTKKEQDQVATTSPTNIREQLKFLQQTGADNIKGIGPALKYELYLVYFLAMFFLYRISTYWAIPLFFVVFTIILARAKNKPQSTTEFTITNITAITLVLIINQNPLTIANHSITGLTLLTTIILISWASNHVLHKYIYKTTT